MRPRDRQRAQQLEDGLLAFHRERFPLPGIQDASIRGCLLEQIMESIHRVRYVAAIRGRDICDARRDPSSELFDPLKAAILFQRDGRLEEAFWMVFLFVHFGRNSRGGWRYAREVYGRLGGNGRWDWAFTSTDPTGFRNWLDANQNQLKRAGVAGGFGNHRKYESLDARGPNGTGQVIETYVRWVNPPRTHAVMFEQAIRDAGGDPMQAFDRLYRSMENIARFGRTAKFDYLCMISKLELVAIEPGSAYLSDSTGPLKGARLLFGGQPAIRPRDADDRLVELDGVLQVGMQVLEDSLCNWQKSPTAFIQFRG